MTEKEVSVVRPAGCVVDLLEKEDPLSVGPPMMTPVPLVVEFPLSVVNVDRVVVTFSDDEPPSVVLPVTMLPPLSVVMTEGVAVTFSCLGVVSVPLMVLLPLTPEPLDQVVLLCDSVVVTCDSVVIFDCVVTD